ncbi:MAG: hypothetical protein RLZZ156_1004, partial [Deinococcota bacterium]
RPRYQRLLKKAEQDFKVAQLLDVEELPSIIAFHVQQGLEKLFKVCIGESGTRAPPIHDLVELWLIACKYVPLEINQTFLELVSAFAIDVRYDIEATPEQAKLALEEALKIRTAVLFWLETKLAS